MDLKGLNIGFALTGSFCTIKAMIDEVESLVNEGANVIPILSENAYSIDTRFGNAMGYIDRLEEITGNRVIHSLPMAEPIGPKKLLDALVVAPCTGNSIAKIANGISDTCVTLAVKAHLRNERPVVIAVSTNDGLGTNAKNIGMLINTKNIYIVPFRQDDPIKKHNSIISKKDMIILAVKLALDGIQIQPVILGTNE